VSAFTGTDLDMTLRANGIETLVLAEIATSGVVVSAVRHMAGSGYRPVVVRTAAGTETPSLVANRRRCAGSARRAGPGGQPRARRTASSIPPCPARSLAIFSRNQYLARDAEGSD
jgi:hypothetical protein